MYKNCASCHCFIVGTRIPGIAVLHLNKTLGSVLERGREREREMENYSECGSERDGVMIIRLRLRTLYNFYSTFTAMWLPVIRNCSHGGKYNVSLMSTYQIDFRKYSAIPHICIIKLNTQTTSFFTPLSSSLVKRFFEGRTANL